MRLGLKKKGEKEFYFILEILFVFKPIMFPKNIQLKKI